MSYRRKIFWAMLSALIAGMGTNVYAQPIFENNTPVGFSTSDSTTAIRFITDKDVSVQVDLNQAANAEFPAIANFQSVEAASAFFSTTSSAAYMSQALKVDANGIIHRTWIQQRGTTDLAILSSTPVYGVVYAKSLNGGKTFSDTISVSGSLRFDMLTTNVLFTGAFSTVDLVVDSKGNPRVVYAMDQSPDGSQLLPSARRTRSLIFAARTTISSSTTPTTAAAPGCRPIMRSSSTTRRRSVLRSTAEGRPSRGWPSRSRTTSTSPTSAQCTSPE